MIQVWYSNISRISKKDFIRQLNSVPKIIQKEVFQYRFFNDQKLKLFGRLLVSKFEEERVGTFSWNDWLVGKHSKPYINHGIQFNISHSEDIVVVAFSESEVGIDIEKKRIIRINEMLNCLHPSEKFYVLKSGNPIDAFYKVWTRKEAYLKAIGQGIVNGLKDENCLKTLIQNKNSDYYTIKTIAFKPDYSLSICSKLESNILHQDDIVLKLICL